MAHAKLSPSGAERWMSCPGSVVLEEGCADSTSEYADEGTAAHALAAMCLTEQKDALAYLGRRLTVINGVYWPGVPDPVPPLLQGQAAEIVRHFDVDEDMADHVQTYLDNVRQYVTSGQGDLLVEMRLPIGHITGEEGAEGTGDAVILADGGAELQLHDLKFGRGVTVSPEENKQLMLYALGALDLARVLGYAPTRARLVIHQPRVISAPQEWPLSIQRLESFAEEVKKASSRVDAAVVFFTEHKQLHDKYFGVSEDACRFCKAKASGPAPYVDGCPAIAAKVQEVIEASFTAIATTPEGERFPVVAPETLSNQGADSDDLGSKLDCVDLIENWCTAVRAEAERRLLRGEAVPSPRGGYKLVAGKKGRRAWSDTTVVEDALKRMRLKKEEMYDFKIISPTSAEKLLKETPKRWSALQQFITQSDGKPHVAPTSDRRDALVIEPIDSQFAPVEQMKDIATVIDAVNADADLAAMEALA